MSAPAPASVLAPGDAVLPDAPECGLDPADWTAMRELGHRMVDDMIEFLSGVGDQPAWRPVPDTVRQRLRAPLPRQGVGAEAAYADFLRDVLPYRLGNVHPRFWGWVMGSGTPVGMLAEMLAAGMNSSSGATESAAPYVEAQVIAWLKEALGFPARATGVLVSGCSMANVVGLAAARARHADPGLGRRGMAECGAGLVAYGSEETHSSVYKAFALLGLGTDALRLVPTDAAFRIRVDVLEQRVRADRAAGLRPFCVIGNAGTVTTGATDDLGALADVCAREGLWLHVDGAFGAAAALSPRLRPLLAGMERADSLAFDLHKWLHMPYEVGCVLVRDPEAHRAAFSVSHAAGGYLAPLERGVAASGYRMDDLGPQLSRSFRALKVWISLKAHGVEAYAGQVEQNVEQAAELARRVDGHPELERLAPAALNVVCFRYAPPGHDPAALDALNAELLMRLQESGVAVPSAASVRGCFSLRVSLTNHRTRRADFTLLLEAVVRLGRELAGEPAGAGGRTSLLDRDDP